MEWYEYWWDSDPEQWDRQPPVLAFVDHAGYDSDGRLTELAEHFEVRCDAGVRPVSHGAESERFNQNTKSGTI